MPLDTFGLTHAVKCHDGKTRKLTGGDYGWCINRDKTTEELIPLLESGAEKKIEPVYLYSAKSRAKDDIGGTYVEISISKQTLWCYKNGKEILETPVVTGNISKATAPPRAVSGPRRQEEPGGAGHHRDHGDTALPSPIGCLIAATWGCTMPMAGGMSTAARSTRPTALTAA